jgi:hypothetical protein
VKPIRETALGSWIARKTPGLLDEVGDLLPDRGALGVIRRVLIASGKLSATDREELDRLIDAEISFSAEVTKRWEADLKADSPLAKVIRPLALIVTLFLFFVILIFDSIDGIGFHVSDAFARLLETLTLTICGAYFAGRTLEKSIRR